MIKKKNVKKAYIVTCPSSFRDRVETLCRRKKVNAGDIARSIILTIDEEAIASAPDPGEPDEKDREPFFAKADKKKQKPGKRKPRIQVRLPEGYNPIFIRKALNLALSLNEGQGQVFQKKEKSSEEKYHEEIERLKTMVFALMFEPLGKEITSKEEAFYILGFKPHARPTSSQIKQRFRMLATIHHPDSELGSNERMLQLNDAVNFLNRNPFY